MNMEREQTERISNLFNQGCNITPVNLRNLMPVLASFALVSEQVRSVMDKNPFHINNCEHGKKKTLHKMQIKIFHI